MGVANNTPQAPQTQQVAVNFTASGLGKLKSQWADFAGNLLTPITVLAAGGTKAQAAWAGMKDVFLTKVLGPLGMVVGVATGFLLVTRNLVREWRAVGLQSAKAIETLTLQFKPLLGSLELAKKRAREVFAFSVKSPFQFGELAEGNKILQGLTQGALAGVKGMKLVGDAAAVAGAGFADTARYVGRLYDGLMSGRPVGEAGMRLQELGIITGQTRNQIESMQASNASGAEIWRVVERDILRAKGAMDALSESVEGLESTQADTQKQLEAGFGSGFLEGEKTAIKSATQVMERLTPVAQTLGENIGSVWNWFARLRAGVVDAVTAFPGFTTIVTGAAVALVGLAGAITAAAGGMLARFAAGVLSAAMANRQLAASAASATAAQAMQAGVTRGLTAAKTALATAVGLAKAGQYAEAAASLKSAAASTVAALRTNALAASQGLLRGALMLTAGAVRFVVGELAVMAAAMLANPIFLIAAALVAAGGAMIYFHNQSAKAREEIEAFDKATNSIGVNLEKMRRNIETIVDLRRAEAEATNQVAAAYGELRKAQEGEGNISVAQAQKRLDLALKAREAIRSTPKSALDKTESQVALADQQREGAKQAARSAAEFQAKSGETSEYGLAVGDYGRRVANADVAAKAMAEEARVAAEQERIQRQITDFTDRRAALAEQKAALEDKIAGYDKMDASSPDFGLSQRLAESSRIKLASVKRQLASMDDAEISGGAEKSQVALESESELARLKEQLKIHDELRGAVNDEADAQAKLAEAKDEARVNAAAELELVQRRVAVARGLAARAGVGDGFNRADAQRNIDRMEAERNDQLDPTKIEEARQRMAEAENRLIQARLDGESQIAGLRLRGYERDRALLEIEREKLKVAQQRGLVDDVAAARQSAVLDAQQAAMEKAGNEKGQELRDAYLIAGLNRREAEARRAGDKEKEAAMRAAADAVEDARTRREATREAEDVTATPEQRAAYVEAKTKEAKAARDAERKRQQEDESLARDKSRADQNSVAGDLKARALQLQGKSKEAKQAREDAARVQDEITRKEKQRAYRDQGFGANEADQMANKDVKSQQADRMMQELMGRKGFVVADSLAKVGGGGNVTGSDPATRLQERMVKLLEEVADNTKDNVETIR